MRINRNIQGTDDKTKAKGMSLYGNTALTMITKINRVKQDKNKLIKRKATIKHKLRPKPWGH